MCVLSTKLGGSLDAELACPAVSADGTPVSDQRRESVGDMPWGVFATIARVAADPTFSGLEDVVKQLEQISGFESLRDVLERHFIQRGHILRCYRILGDAQKILDNIRFTHLRKLRKEIRRNKDLLDEFLGFIHRPGGDPWGPRDRCTARTIRAG